MDFEAVCEMVQKGKMADVKTAVQAAVDEGVAPSEILQNSLVKAMKIMGQKMQSGEAYIPEVLIASKAMSAGLEILEPILADSGEKPKGTVVIATVKGDLHDIGKNLVSIMFKGAGFKVIDLGVNADSKKFVEAAKEHNPDVIGLSALLTTTMTGMKSTIEAIRAEGIDSVILAGGAPVTESFAKESGADGYSDDAPGAVDAALELLEKKNK